MYVNACVYVSVCHYDFESPAEYAEMIFDVFTNFGAVQSLWSESINVNVSVSVCF